MSDLKMPDLNRVMLAGRLTRDPESHQVGSGSELCKLGLAVSRKYKTKTGDPKEETLFINVTCWGKTAEWAGKNLKKGEPVLIEGKLKSDEWEDKTTGQKRTAIEVTAERVHSLEWPRKEGGQAQTVIVEPDNSGAPF